MDKNRAQRYLDLAKELKPVLEGPKGEEASQRLEADYQMLQGALAWFIDN